MFSRFPGLSNMFGPNSNNNNDRAHFHPGQNLPHSSSECHINNEHDYAGTGNAAGRRNQTFGVHRNHPSSNTVIKDGEGSSCEVDNSWAVMAKISSLYYEKVMSDIILVISGKEYPSHRLILCASSDVFQVMLMNRNWSEALSTRVELQESTECAEYFEDFLQYLYTGKAKLELGNVLHLLTLADKYNVKDLVDICLDYMIKHIPAAANNCKLIHWYQSLTIGGHTVVSEACKNFIKWNFEFVAKANDFWELDLELLVSIILEDDLVVYDEYSLFQYIDNWATSQVRKLVDDPFREEKMLQIVQDSMACIRFPMMSPRQLADLLLSGVTQKYKEYFMEKMAIGVAFHSDLVSKLMDLVLQHPYRTKLFTPRHYCTDKWSVCLSVDRFSSLPHYQSKTLVFSTPLSFAEKYSDKQMEWVVDLSPKGVWFNKFYLIVWQGTLECPEQVMKTVRLSVQCKNSDEEYDQTPIRVQIGILIAGVENDVEHVRRVIKRNYIFSGRDKILNFDDILPYDELVRTFPTCNTSDHNYSTSSGNISNNDASASSSSKSSNENISSLPKNSCYLLGKDSLKIRIVITPMCEIKI